MSAREVDFKLHGGFFCRQELSAELSGAFHIIYKNGHVTDTRSGKEYDSLLLTPENEACYIEIQKVSIGIDFHWERSETQCFSGSLNIISDGQQLVVINIIAVERYLQSVISSEMSAGSSLEFLKTHAVISRSWVLAQINKQQQSESGYNSCVRTDTEWIQWFDHEDHRLFDVCADDHCQRYQGITRIVSPTVKEAIDATSGMILCYKGEICDARFSKCCGGVVEAFENIWAPCHHPYLVKVSDAPAPFSTRLNDELQAKEWILSAPEAFCNTADKTILTQALNHYDLETSDFFRWQVSYKQHELSALIADRAGIDFGHILNLVPLERGVSGRIIKLRIEGTQRSMTIGKELLIRRCLSTSHLYSSAFIVEKGTETDGIPQSFVLHGAGWGHGVGLCQIGAAVMCAKGYTYWQVLSHYYPDSEIIINY
jgi:SpoIID/LytB domain protein